MATWTSLLSRTASVVMNDGDRAAYTDAVLLPHLNTCLSELQELFELNNIPVTNDESATIVVPANTSEIGFSTVPALPSDLVEIQQLFESQTGQNSWIPVTKKEYLTASILGAVPISMFGIWVWEEQAIKVRPAVNPIDIRMNYIKTIFIELTIGMLGNQNTVLNTDSFITYRVGGLAAEFIEENFSRADKANAYAISGLERSLGISIKGKQSIAVRRRPFRAAFKRRRTMI